MTPLSHIFLSGDKQLNMRRREYALSVGQVGEAIVFTHSRLGARIGNITREIFKKLWLFNVPLALSSSLQWTFASETLVQANRLSTVLPKN